MDRDDVQGLIFSGYSRLRASALLGLTFSRGEPNAWLRRALPSVSAGSRGQRFAGFQLNLAITARGLGRFGVDAETLEQFPLAFRQGMAEPSRSQLLGDVGPDAPAEWLFGGDEASTPDALLFAYAEGAPLLEKRLEELAKSLERFGLATTTLRTFLPADGREHFGSRMSVSQPSFRGSGHGRALGPRLALGEFVLGYRDASGHTQRGPTAPRGSGTRRPPPLLERGRRVDLGFNGSYLVLRQIEQRIEAFRALVAARAAQAGVAPELAQARLFGRWPNGASLALFPEAEPSECPPERFAYDELDADGRRCPLDAHVRLSHPRSSKGGREAVDHHRLIRRGRLYGQTPGSAEVGERGLVFVALNADITRQFEHVQARWLGGQHDPLRAALRVRGGAYAFLPSLSTLGYLADLGAQSP